LTDNTQTGEVKNLAKLECGGEKEGIAIHRNEGAAYLKKKRGRGRGPRGFKPGKRIRSWKEKGEQGVLSGPNKGARGGESNFADNRGGGKGRGRVSQE